MRPPVRPYRNPYTVKMAYYYAPQAQVVGADLKMQLPSWGQRRNKQCMV